MGRARRMTNYDCDFFPGTGTFGQKIQAAKLDDVVGSRMASTSPAED